MCGACRVNAVQGPRRVARSPTRILNAAEPQFLPLGNGDIAHTHITCDVQVNM